MSEWIVPVVFVVLILLVFPTSDDHNRNRCPCNNQACYKTEDCGGFDK